MYPAAIDPLALSRRPPPSGKRWTRIVYLVACSIALLVALYLFSMKLTGHISDLAGCGGEGGCADILGGRWANWLRVPISLWAIIVYVPLLTLGFLGLTTPVQRRLAMIGTGILVAAAIWFLYIQAAVEQQFCPYCLLLHGCGAIAFVCVLIDVWSGDLVERAVSLLLAGGLASLALMALAVGQYFGPQPDTHVVTIEDQLAEMSESMVARHTTSADMDRTPSDLSDPDASTAAGTSDAADAVEDVPTSADDPATDLTEEPDAGGTLAEQPAAANDEPFTSEAPGPPADEEPARVVSYFDGVIRMRVGEMPIIGRPDARHVLLKYFDYTCSSCRRMHHDLEAAVAAYPDDLAVIVIPCPLNTNCNPHADRQASLARGPGSHEFACELARLGLAMWRIAPNEFERFHNELFEHQARMTPAAATLIGDTMLQGQRLEEASRDPWIDSVLEESVSIYGRMKRANPRMPKVLLGGRKVLHGVVSSETLTELLRRELQLGEPLSP